MASELERESKLQPSWSGYNLCPATRRALTQTRSSAAVQVSTQGKEMPFCFLQVSISKHPGAPLCFLQRCRQNQTFLCFISGAKRCGDNPRVCPQDFPSARSGNVFFLHRQAGGRKATCCPHEAISWKNTSRPGLFFLCLDSI